MVVFTFTVLLTIFQDYNKVLLSINFCVCLFEADIVRVQLKKLGTSSIRDGRSEGQGEGNDAQRSARAASAYLRRVLIGH